eukprot:6901802-Heterocapsa_arctica.AAC.1
MGQRIGPLEDGRAVWGGTILPLHPSSRRSGHTQGVPPRELGEAGGERGGELAREAGGLRAPGQDELLPGM